MVKILLRPVFNPTSYHNEQISVGSCENRNVHWDTQRVRLVQTNAEVSLAT